MDSLTSEQIQQIDDALTSVGISNKCSQCQTGTMFVQHRYGVFAITNDPARVDLFAQPPQVCALRACDRCGFMTFHHLSVLGLLPQAPSQ